MQPKKRQAGQTLIENLADTGKRRVEKVSRSIENEFLYDLVRGKDVQRWGWRSEWSIVLPQDPASPSRAVAESELKIKYPKTFRYFKTFEADIRDCALLAQFFDPKTDPFYSSYNVGDYTFSQHRVVWKEISREITAAVISEPVVRTIPDHKLVMLALDSAEHAHYVCGLLNSSPIRAFVRCYAIQTSLSGHIFEFVRFSRFDPKNADHKQIAKLSKQCHEVSNDDAKLSALERRLDQLASKYWGLKAEEMASIARYLQG